MTVQQFLDKHLIDPDTVDMDKMCNFAMQEMKNGLEGKDSSLAMIDSYCNPDCKIVPSYKVAVIDAGGTNFRTCIVSFDQNGNAAITDLKKSKMPGIEKEVSAEEFFKIIADEVERLVEKTDKIGFCFSYAAKILPNHDGIPLIFSKEIKAPKVIGKNLGKELFAELESRGHDMSNKKIIILNDTVTTLLAGLTKTQSLGCEGCIGFILGTGTNIAFIHKQTIINEESGGLDIIVGDIDQEFMETTQNPEKQHLEKSISGAYLGKAASLVVKHAYQEGVVSDCVDFDTKQLGDFLDDENNKINSPQLYEILEKFVKRAAKLNAVALGATIMMTDFGIKKPILINADGTTYYKTKFLQQYTEKYLEDYLSKYGRKALFTQIENSPTLGSAIGAFSL